MSAPFGTDATSICASAAETLELLELLIASVLPPCWNLACSNLVSPLMNAVISVPFGIVMSFPCMNRKNGAAGKNTIAVATMPPVIAPVWPPPFASFTARSGTFSPSTRRTASMLTLSFPPRAILRLGSASVTVPQAILPFATTRVPPTRTSSRTSKSRVSPVCASAEEIVRAVLNLIGVPSSNPKPCIAGFGALAVAAGTCCGWPSAVCCGKANGEHKRKANILQMILLSTIPPGGQGLSDVTEVRGEGSPDKP